MKARNSIFKTVFGGIIRKFRLADNPNPLSEHIGKIAVTDTDLHPSGTVLIDNEVFEAVSLGNNIEPGRGVRVTGVRGKNLLVRLV